jgi:hypothetical protein
VDYLFYSIASKISHYLNYEANKKNLVAAFSLNGLGFAGAPDFQK